MISESADLGKLVGAKKLSAGMKNISGELNDVKGAFK